MNANLAGARRGIAALMIGACGMAGLLAVPSGASAATTPQIYWANNGGNTIGRANLDGTGVNQSFITGVTSVLGLGVDGQNLFFGNDPGFPGIGEADLGGLSVTTDFIPGASPQALAANVQHLYWSDPGSGTIGRANLNGTGANQSFITGATVPNGLAVDGQYIYWTNGTGTIGRANVDGTGANQSFITGANAPDGLAVSIPVISVAPTTPDAFPTTLPNSESTARTLTISNSGQRALTITPSLTGADPSDFLITANDCPVSISPGSSCRLTIAFAPRSRGSLSAELEILSNDYADNPTSIPLTGTTPSTPTPKVRVTITVCRTVVHGDGDGDEGPADEGHAVTHRCAHYHVKVVELRRDGQVSTARLARRHHLYAEGRARYRKGRWQLSLTGHRTLRRGSYVLVISAKRHGHWIIQRRTIRL